MTTDLLIIYVKVLLVFYFSHVKVSQKSVFHSLSVGFGKLREGGHKLKVLEQSRPGF